ncbi:MAG TPA: hypothetical protein VNB06_01525, partial [Thermoanaerobaculia bacterium]|nr:hypothetical protein [Thermoanaerobaculia bacterium]
FWAPSGTSIGFFRLAGSEAGEKEDTLWRIDLGSDRAALICRLPGSFRGGAWSSNDQILIGSGWDSMYRVSASGGAPEAVTNLAASDAGHRWPEWLPDARHFLFAVFSDNPERAGLYLGSIERGEMERLSANYGSARWAEPGYVLFVRDGNLVARRFDSDRLELEGQPRLVASGIQQTRYGRAVFSVGGKALLAYGTGNPGQQLTWTDRAGRVLGTLGPIGDYHDFSLSPDGSMAVVSRFGPGLDFWLYEVERNTSRPLTSTREVDETYPVWSPGQRSVAFSVLRAPPPGSPRGPLGVLNNTYRLELTEPAEPELIVEGFSPHDWTPHGLVVGTDGILRQISLDGQSEPAILLDSSQFIESYRFRARLSPDGGWLAYVSQETGSPQVFLKSLADGRVVQISRDPGGYRPRWAPDGREVFYLGSDGMLMSVTVGPRAGMKPGEPVPLFALGGDAYAVAPDGERFLVKRVDPEAVSPPVTVVTNWQRLLE